MSKRAELYACVYVKDCPMQAMLRLYPMLRHLPTILFDGERSNQQVCSVNNRAFLDGFREEMTRAEAELFPKHVALTRCMSAEMATHAAVLECAGVYSPRIEIIAKDRDLICVVDIAGTSRLYGTPEMLAESLVSRLHALDIYARVGVSANFYTSVCAAKGRANDAWQVIPSGKEEEYLFYLPWSVLDLTPAQREIVELWGVSTIGELTALSRRELASRMGCDGERLYRLATGTLSHHFRPLKPSFLLKDYLEFEAPVTLLDPLLFAMEVMIERLLVRARAHCVALAEIETSLFFSDGESHIRLVRTVRPSLDKHLWLKLLNLDFNAEPPVGAVVALSMRAEPGSETMVQFGLFSTQLPESGQLDVTLGRVGSIVGEDRAGRALLSDAHWYEGDRVEPFAVENQELSMLSLLPGSGAMSCLQSAKSMYVKVQDGRPALLYLSCQKFIVEHSYGPWNTSGAWWTRLPWAIDQWDVVARGADGVMLTCCILRDLLKDEWRISGFYD